MEQNQFESKSSSLDAKEILNSNLQFKRKATEISAVLGYNRKLYAEDVFELYKDGPYKGYACGPGNNSKINFWEDYIKSIGADFAIRQLELHVSNKLDNYTGGRDEANYDFEKDHYILYETRKLKNAQESNGQLHIDNAEAVYLYETGTRTKGRVDTNTEDARYDQYMDIVESVRLPQGSITERFYLKHSRQCPDNVFIDACIESGSVDAAISEMDKSDLRKAMNFFTSQSYMNFTAAADYIDKEKYDYVQLPNGHVVVLNVEVLLDPEEIAQKELSDFENKRVEEMYQQYLNQDTSAVTRGTEADIQQFTKFLQSF